ncbi:hypothetical protein NQ315_012907 [Exocentrus adspersus]|uniref:DDE Tnp4 domain-containing protein n=1 Tax=Exocentrus adspersus TaxID=1586481 RepID=A0AAV8VSJ7_9CUCU|nr:hypothetical protein NQ315_012907 [Exocentrus adspersus]
MEIYAQAIRDKGGALPNCWGFIDGTARAICKPTNDQENYYSGHKRFHCIKYQSVLCPDGIIASLKGGWPGRRHDAAIFTQSNLYAELQQVAVFPNNNYVLYGDQAYGVRELLLAPYRTHINLEDYQRQFNASMKLLRVAVEWGVPENVESMYKVGVLLTNCHTTLYSSQTAQYFYVNPPGLEEYIGE